MKLIETIFLTLIIGMACMVFLRVGYVVGKWIAYLWPAVS